MTASYDYYRVFYYVAKYKSFTQAAAVLINSQPNVTRTIKNLEACLGCALFVRNNRGVRLTPEGEKLYVRVSAAFEQIQAGEEELLLRKSMNSGIISIGASETALHGLLLTVLSKYHQKHPNVKLKITNHSTPQAIKALNNGLVDLALVTTPIEKDEKLAVSKIKPFRDILVCGTDFSHLTKSEISLYELAEFPIVSLADNTKTYKFYADLFLEAGLNFKPDIEVATAGQILPIVEHNLGIGFLPDVFANEAITQKRIFPLDLKENIPTRHICLAKRSDQTLSIAAAGLQKMITEFKNPQ